MSDEHQQVYVWACRHVCVLSPKMCKAYETIKALLLTLRVQHLQEFHIRCNGDPTIGRSGLVSDQCHTVCISYHEHSKRFTWQTLRRHYTLIMGTSNEKVNLLHSTLNYILVILIRYYLIVFSGPWSSSQLFFGLVGWSCHMVRDGLMGRLMLKHPTNILPVIWLTFSFFQYLPT